MNTSRKGAPDFLARIGAALEGAQFAVAVHNYGELDPAIVHGIAAEHLGDLEVFASEVLKPTVSAG
jgi:hypothetical protein